MPHTLSLNQIWNYLDFVLPCWSSARFGPLSLENQNRSIGVILDVLSIQSEVADSQIDPNSMHDKI